MKRLTHAASGYCFAAIFAAHAREIKLRPPDFAKSFSTAANELQVDVAQELIDYIDISANMASFFVFFLYSVCIPGPSYFAPANQGI